MGKTIKPSPGRKCKLSAPPEPVEPPNLSASSLVSPPDPLHLSLSPEFGHGMGPWKTSNTSIKRTESPISILHTVPTCVGEGKLFFAFSWDVFKCKYI